MLFTALYYDNTESAIVYEFLKLLSIENKAEFTLEYPWRKIFLSQKDISKLSSLDPLAKKDAKSFFEKIIEEVAKEKDNKNWGTKIFSNFFVMKNPYILQKDKTIKNDVKYHYINRFNANEKFEFLYEMRPNLELSCFDENNVYKYLLYLVQKASFYTQNNIPCALDIFLVLDQLIKKKTDYTIIWRIFEIFMSMKSLVLTSTFLHHLRKKYDLQIQFKSLLPDHENNYEYQAQKYLYFEKHKTFIQNHLFSFISSINKSNCIVSLLQKCFPLLKEDLHLINDEFLQETFKKTNFQGLFMDYQDGYTNNVFLTVTINIFQNPNIFEK